MKQQKVFSCLDRGIATVCNIPGVGNIQLESVESKDEPVIVCVHIDATDPVSHTLELGWDHKIFENYHCYTQYAEGEEASFNLLIQACQLLDVFEYCAIIEWNEKFYRVATALGLEVYHFHCPTWVPLPPLPQYVCIHDLRQQRSEVAQEIVHANNEVMARVNAVARLYSLLRAIDVAIQVEEGVPAGTVIQ
jgi:hypothetical protein